MTWKDICVFGIISIVIVLAMPSVAASSGSLSDLKSLISGFDDPRMNTDDLAFFLASHGFDASPKGSFVEVDFNGCLCKLAPNGPAPGLCSIAA